MPDYEHWKSIAESFGVMPEFIDIFGNRRTASKESLKLLLAAMGVPIDDVAHTTKFLARREALSWQRPLEPVMVIREDDFPTTVSLTLPRALASRPLPFLIEEEGGKERLCTFFPADAPALATRVVDGTEYVRFSLGPGLALGQGYHRLSIPLGSRGRPGSCSTSLIVVPSRCHTHRGLERQGQTWGFAVQLYALKSKRNWGMGDFTDLKRLVEISGNLGAGVVGLNPLHSLFLKRPTHAGPYSPSSRLFLNPLYLDISAIPDFSECEEARTKVAATEFQSLLKNLREKELVDYQGVAGAKLPVLYALYNSFRDRHLLKKTSRADEFKDFVARGGDTLKSHALFESLEEHFQTKGVTGGWRAWPAPFRRPDSREASAFAVGHVERVEFYQYLQWQADLQLIKAQEKCAERGLPLGLYRDLAVSSDKGGSEAWGDQSLYALKANVGAPPDEFNLLGQDWGLPPMIPHRLKEEAYIPFIRLLRSNMRHAGALRIDHVMALCRLYWIPEGFPATEGVYVRYPLEDLMGIVALESVRNRCVVIGEDLGTVPDEVRYAMREKGVLSYKLFYFERTDGDEYFKPSKEYPDEAIASISTHDLPTLKGYWEGRDLEIKDQLGLFPNEEVREKIFSDRQKARWGLIKTLARERLLPDCLSVHEPPPEKMSEGLALAVHRFLARAIGKIKMVQIEDALGRVDQANMPGTADEHPNWRRKVAMDLEDIANDSRVLKIGEVFSKERE